MSEKWYFNETIIGIQPAQQVQYEYNFTSNGTQYKSIALFPFIASMMYAPVSGSVEIPYAKDSGWQSEAYRTIELAEPATGDFLTFLQKNATNISSGGPVEPTSVKLVNKVVLGSDTVLDLTSDTVSPETLLVGTTAHNAKGETITGTLVPCVTYSATNPQITAAEDSMFTWQVPSTEHGFNSSDLFVSVYLSNGEQIFCDVVVSPTDYSVTITAVYSSGIQTLAVPSTPTVPAGYLKVVIIGPATTS